MIGGVGDIHGAYSKAKSMNAQQLADVLQRPPGASEVPQFVAFALLNKLKHNERMQGGDQPPPGGDMKTAMLSRIAQSGMPPGGLKDMAGAMAPAPTTYAADGMFGRATGGDNTSLEGVRPLWEIIADMAGGNVGDGGKREGGWNSDENLVPTEIPGYIDGMGRERRVRDQFVRPGFLKWKDFEMPPTDGDLPPLQGPPMPASFGGGASDGGGASGDWGSEPGIAGPVAGVPKKEYNDWLALAEGAAVAASGRPEDLSKGFSTGIAALNRNRAYVDEQNRNDALLDIEREKLELARLAATAKGTSDPALGPIFDRIGALEEALGPNGVITRDERIEAEKELQNLKGVVNRALRIASAGGGGDLDFNMSAP